MHTKAPSSTTAAARKRFVTLGGQAMLAVTRSEMREIDRIAVEETGPSLAQMMENAGRSLTVLVMRLLAKAHSSARVLVVSGTGGNGGGGVCAARHLSSRVGQVDLALTDPDGLSVMTARQLRVFQETAGRQVALDDLGNRESYDIVVDAVLGYGLRGSPKGAAERAVLWIDRSADQIVSLDLPSGIDADTGEAPGAHVSAAVTLTLHMPKPGLASATAGDLCVADLGIPRAVMRRMGIEAPVYGPAFATPLARV